MYLQSPSYEDMLLLSSLLGPAKPPVASSENVAAAGGLFRVAGDAQCLVAENAQGDGTLQIGPGERCLVCLEEYQPQEEIRQLNKCLHVFHQGCIDEWLTTARNSCPLCRGEGVSDNKDSEQSQTGT